MAKCNAVVPDWILHWKRIRTIKDILRQLNKVDYGLYINYILAIWHVGHIAAGLPASLLEIQFQPCWCSSVVAC